MDLPENLRRRSFLLGAGALGAGAALAGCTGNSSKDDTANVAAPAASSAGGGGGNDAIGQKVVVGFSAPAADHGWIGAITKNAKAQAAQYSDVELKATEGTNDTNQQISQVETLINAKVGVLVILPYDGKALTEVATKAMDAGIPVVNLDRVFDSPLAYRIWIGGDNYGMGVAAGTYIAKAMKDKGVSSPVIAEIPGIDSLPLTQQRSKGFADALKAAGFKVANRVPADFTPEGGEKAASNLLQAAGKIDAIWNHDDDQGIGVLSAIESAKRSEFVLVGGAGSKNAMDAIKADNGVLKCTVTYSPSMSSSAIKLARLIGHSKGMSDLVEKEVPTSITLASATVTKDNVDQYMQFGFTS
ncbi:ribose transport system substrate-binding protein [Motilibacter peucedani]|uniref:Ribose transport system substrate-binding protein n=1 Tax=Motilibacter peucedani TaxID=598650 RepID=A0A420XK83_9ACTN|nr:substrate-binding domain-containing protein [Motilibacter peucedani]RKS68532.1 ribose transport system substrate-binding protein [Motilibacter peucedani]